MYGSNQYWIKSILVKVWEPTVEFKEQIYEIWRLKQQFKILEIKLNFNQGVRINYNINPCVFIIVE